jgi:hypothetical protein
VQDVARVDRGGRIDSNIAVNIFRRWGLEVMANPYSDTATNSAATASEEFAKPPSPGRPL